MHATIEMLAGQPFSAGLTGHQLTTRFVAVMGDRLHAARRRFADCRRESGHRTEL